VAWQYGQVVWPFFCTGAAAGGFVGNTGFAFSKGWNVRVCASSCSTVVKSRLHFLHCNSKAVDDSEKSAATGGSL
jgi:hypothetical protein